MMEIFQKAAAAKCPSLPAVWAADSRWFKVKC